MTCGHVVMVISCEAGFGHHQAINYANFYKIVWELI